MSDDPNIEVMENGPYMVTGDVTLKRKAPVMSEHGEPLTWRSSGAEATRARYALCRCGASANKPFCDGTHNGIDFDGTESASEDAYTARSAELGGTGITVSDDRSICMHAGFCGNRVSNVWKMTRSTDDSVVRAQVMAMIEKCPSGALTYAVGDEPVEPDLPVEIAVVADGPLWVSGEIPVTRSDGRPLEVRNRVTLCRCGASSNKPLCDGTHKEIGFEG
jgi:CDGSH-type Zn-finger protein